MLLNAYYTFIKGEKEPYHSYFVIYFLATSIGAFGTASYADLIFI